MSAPASKPARTVMIYSMGEVIGDGLIKLPFMAAVRAAYPGAHITWCAAGGDTVYTTTLKPVVVGLIDEVLVEGRLGAGALDMLSPKPFGGRRFDEVIDTQSSPLRTLTARRAARGVFVSPTAGFALCAVRPKVWPDAVAQQLMTLLSLATGREEPPRAVTLADPRAGQAAEALLPAGRAYIGFAPGAGGASKRWPLERFIALAADQTAKGRTPVFLIGPGEGEIVEAVRAALPNALMPEVDRTDAFADVKGPLLAIALAQRLAAGVANDAGPGHMLAAGGCPLLSLQQDRRKAVKFRPAAARLALLIAEDYGEGMQALPLDPAITALDALIAGAA